MHLKRGVMQDPPVSPYPEFLDITSVDPWQWVVINLLESNCEEDD